MTIVSARILRPILLVLAGSALCACSGLVPPTTPSAPATPPPSTTQPAATTLTRLEVSSSSMTILGGSTQKVRALGTFDDGSSADVTDLATWRTSDDSIAVVDDGDPAGVTLYTNRPGTFLVTASLGSISGSATFTVTVALRSIVVSAGATTRIAPCGSHRYVAIGSFSDGTQRDVTAQVAWSSSDESIATAADSDGARGLVTVMGAGAATITARAGDVAGTIDLVADPTVPKELAVSPTNLTVTAGQAVAFTTTAGYCDGSYADVTMTAAWSSSAPDVATIDQVEAGAHIANTAQPGTSWISARLGDLSDAIALEVQPPTLQSLFVSTPTLSTTIALGSTTPFVATASYSDGSSPDVTGSVQWSSSDPTIATVAADGSVTAVACGSVTIMAALDGEYGSLAVTVSP